MPMGYVRMERILESSVLDILGSCSKPLVSSSAVANGVPELSYGDGGT